MEATTRCDVAEGVRRTGARRKHSQASKSCNSAERGVWLTARKRGEAGRAYRSIRHPERTLYRIKTVYVAYGRREGGSSGNKGKMPQSPTMR